MVAGVRNHLQANGSIEFTLWAVVEERLAFVEKTYGVGPGRPPRGGAHVAYSSYLLVF